jgi:prenyltransferase beta subunit
MRRHWLWAAFVSLTLLSTATPSLAAEDATTTDTIDLQVTGELIKRWGSRPSFPESVTFSYYHVYMLRALDQEIAPDTERRIANYIKQCQQPDGGFTPKPLHTKTSNVIYTYYALKTLDLLGNTKLIDTQAASRFLRGRVQQGGGITATSKDGEQANLATTYYGIEALRLLGTVDILEKTPTVSFIQRYREKGRGFMRVEGGTSIPQATFMGVRALKSLGALTDKVSREVVTYLKGTRYSGLVEDQQYRLLPSIEAMAYTLEAFATLSAMQQVNADRVHEFIRSLYVSANGGFGPRPGLGTAPASTYHAILSLVRLGKLPDPITHKRRSRAVAAP